METNNRDNLKDFIEVERGYFTSIDHGIEWESDNWDCKNWIFHRGSSNSINFKELGLVGQKATAPLPLLYADFCKAIAVHVKRTKNANFSSVQKYVIECKRLFSVLKKRNETSPKHFTRWHFDETLDMLKSSNYKNLYDAATTLQVIAEIVDTKRLTPLPLHFKHSLKPSSSRHAYLSTSEIDSNIARESQEKLPSYEAMRAFAICTNNPINDSEEILLRTIDLLIVMGQRGNEVTLIPLKCWVERTVKDNTGKVVKDARGNAIVKTGIRYYAEKKFQSRVHWLADQDIPLAKRAVERLKILTQEARKVALFQEQNPGRIWDFPPDEELDDDTILGYLGYSDVTGLYNFLTRIHKVSPVYEDKTYGRKSTLKKRRLTKRLHYKVTDIESILLPQLGDHIALKENIKGKWKTILKTSEVLSIRFEGEFRFKRSANTFKVFPGRITLEEINKALGSSEEAESIFDRRNLKEADGRRIVMTSHQPRHWRNTLYELAGMSNVQQALAMGRQKIDQNIVYQHTTVSEKTQAHRDFISFNTVADKVSFIQDGIREKRILGNLSEVYHSLAKGKGLVTAETFLKTHANALHITPFGGCTHDFSQSPCLKHLQCWNGCSHLHRLNIPGETERIKEQIALSEKALEAMMEDGKDEYGSEVWVNDLRGKINNMKEALKLDTSETPTKIFPEGKEFASSEETKSGSSVSNY